MRAALYVLQWIIGGVGFVLFAWFLYVMGWFIWSKTRDWKEDDIRLGRRFRG